MDRGPKYHPIPGFSKNHTSWAKYSNQQYEECQQDPFSEVARINLIHGKQPKALLSVLNYICREDGTLTQGGGQCIHN